MFFDQDINISQTVPKHSGTHELCDHHVLPVDGWAEQGEIISFDFHTDPEHQIELWIMDNDEYDNFEETDNLGGIHILTDSSATGEFIAVYESRWYVVFINPTSPCTMLTYNITFPPYIMITHPISTTNIAPGSDLKISWESNIGGEGFKIDLYKGSSFITTINSFTINDGIEYWEIPENYEYGDDYNIKITALTSGEFDYSQEFSIKRVIINVFCPYGDRVLVPYTTQKIVWINTGLGPTVRIDLYLNSTLVLEITDEAPSGKEFYWEVWQGFEYSSFTYSDYHVRVQDVSDPSIFGFSTYFTITNVKYIDVLSPVVNSSYVTDDSINITWKTDTLCSIVHIELRAERKNIHNITAASNNGEFIWKIPSSIKSNDRYQIFIRADDNSAWAYSNFFKIKHTDEQVPGFNPSIFLVSIILISVCIILRQKFKIKLYNKSKTLRRSLDINIRAI